MQEAKVYVLLKESVTSVSKKVVVQKKKTERKETHRNTGMRSFERLFFFHDLPLLHLHGK